MYSGHNISTDGAIVTIRYNIAYRPSAESNTPERRELYDQYSNFERQDRLHASAGVRDRIIINRNFIIALDYAIPFNRQDGTGSFYLNTGYLF